MKIEQEVEVFRPVTITLESLSEVMVLAVALGSLSNDRAAQEGKEQFPSHVALMGKADAVVFPMYSRLREIINGFE